MGGHTILLEIVKMITKLEKSRAFNAFCYIPFTFVDTINVFDCHLSDVFIEYTEIVAKTIRN